VTVQKKPAEVGQDAAASPDGLDRLPPYTADVRAKGWRFEIDHERIEQSRTWALSPAELRPWLLMLWLTAWRQTPCGSLDDDDALIAARIGMSPKLFAKHRDVLRRGWWLASDGRLYHDTIVLFVQDMMERRRSESDRKARNRAKQDVESRGSPAVVPRDKGATPAESSTGTGTSTRVKRTPPTPQGGSAFGDFWELHPRKVGKPKAEKAFAAAVARGAKPDEILAGLKRHLPGWAAKKAAGEGNLIPHPTTWLNRDGWNDEVMPDAANGEGGNWWDTRTGTERKGEELGLEVPARADSSEAVHAWNRFMAAVWVECGEGPWWDKASVAYPIACRMRDGDGSHLRVAA
jgi:hypothetical protein